MTMMLALSRLKPKTGSRYLISVLCKVAHDSDSSAIWSPNLVLFYSRATEGANLIASELRDRASLWPHTHTHFMQVFPVWQHMLVWCSIFEHEYFISPFLMKRYHDELLFVIKEEKKKNPHTGTIILPLMTHIFYSRCHIVRHTY